MDFFSRITFFDQLVVIYRSVTFFWHITHPWDVFFLNNSFSNLLLPNYNDNLVYKKTSRHNLTYKNRTMNIELILYTNTFV